MHSLRVMHMLAAVRLTLWAHCTLSFSISEAPAEYHTSQLYVNDVILRSLTRTGVPSMKEPHGLVCDDDKRPDGLTLLPWNSGRRRATWDVTVVDTLGIVPTSQQSAITEAGAANTAAVSKTKKYSSLCRTHNFFSIRSGNS